MKILATLLLLLSFSPPAHPGSQPAKPKDCVLYVKHEFLSDTKIAHQLAAKVDEILLGSKPMQLAQPLGKGNKYCTAHFEKYEPGVKLRTGQKELAVVRWFGPTSRATMEFELWYFVYDVPSPRRTRNTEGFPLPEIGNSKEELEKAAKGVAQVVETGNNT